MTSDFGTKKIGKRGGNVVTYFCTPDYHVLGWVVGPVTAEHLVAEARRAVDTAYVVSRVASLDEKTQRQQVHEHLLSQMHPVNRQGIRQWTNFAKTASRPITNESVSQVLSLAKRTRLNTTHQYPSANAIKFRNPDFVADWKRNRNTMTSDLSRMVISEFPLIKLEQLQRPVFESLANQKFEPRTGRNTKLAAAVKDSITHARPTVLVVDEDIEDRSRNSPLPDLLAKFTVLKLSLKELTRLADDLDHPPVESSSGRICIVVINSSGKRTSVIVEDSARSKRRRYRSILRNPIGRAESNLTTILVPELKRAIK